LRVQAVAAHPTDANIVVAGVQGSGLKISTNGGSTWTAGPAGLSTAMVDAITFDGTHPQFAYATARSTSVTPVAPLWRSTDGGLTFAAVTSNLGNVTATRIAVDPKNSARIFLSSVAYGVGVDGVFRSDDSGVTWAQLSPASAFDIAVDPENPNRLYAAAGWLQISDDAGATFTASPGFSGSKYGNAFRIAIDPHSSNVLYVLTADCPTGNGDCEFFVLRSVDRGVSFERIPNSTLPTWAPGELAINSASPTTVFVGAASRGLHAFDIAPDLSLSITGHSGTKPAGLPSYFDVGVRNLGPFAATGVVYTVTLPAGTRDISATIPQGSCAVVGQAVTCLLPALKVTDVASARVSYTPAAVDSVAVQAGVSARESDPVPANNSAVATAVMGEVVDLVVTGSSSVAALDRGASFTYTFQVKNEGPSASSATGLSIALDAGTTLSGTPPSGCTAAAGALTCSLGALQAGASASVTINAVASGAGTLRTSASATRAAAAVEANAGNDAATVEVTSRALSSGGGGSTDAGGGGGHGGGGALSLPFVIGLGLFAVASGVRRRRQGSVAP
jgi:uncharacterized repeat protein (TIGR01451 family)